MIEIDRRRPLTTRRRIVGLETRDETIARAGDREIEVPAEVILARLIVGLNA